MGSVSAYQVGGVHRHTPEIEQALAEATGATPTVLLHPAAGAHAPRHPGHLHGPAGPPGRGRGRLDARRQALATAYADEPFVHVLPEGRWPATASTLGSNAVHLQVGGRRRTPAAPWSWPPWTTWSRARPGRPIQIANLMLGLPEAAGLTANGVAP